MVVTGEPRDEGLASGRYPFYTSHTARTTTYFVLDESWLSRLGARLTARTVWRIIDSSASNKLLVTRTPMPHHALETDDDARE